MVLVEVLNICSVKQVDALVSPRCSVRKSPQLCFSQSLILNTRIENNIVQGRSLPNPFKCIIRFHLADAKLSRYWKLCKVSQRKLDLLFIMKGNEFTNTWNMFYSKDTPDFRRVQLNQTVFKCTISVQESEYSQITSMWCCRLMHIRGPVSICH
jgi:hypothetical protein